MQGSAEPEQLARQRAAADHASGPFAGPHAELPIGGREPERLAGLSQPGRLLRDPVVCALPSRRDQLDLAAPADLGSRTVEDEQDTDALAVGPRPDESGQLVGGDVRPDGPANVRGVDERDRQSSASISAAARCPDRAAPSIVPPSESVCSPASKRRPYRRRITRQKLVTWPGA